MSRATAVVANARRTNQASRSGKGAASKHRRLAGTDEGAAGECRRDENSHIGYGKPGQTSPPAAPSVIANAHRKRKRQRLARALSVSANENKKAADAAEQGSRRLLQRDRVGTLMSTKKRIARRAVTPETLGSVASNAFCMDRADNAARGLQFTPRVGHRSCTRALRTRRPCGGRPDRTPRRRATQTRGCEIRNR